MTEKKNALDVWRRAAERVGEILRERGHEVDADPVAQSVTIDGEPVSFRVLRERSREGWLSRYTGNFRVSVYEYLGPTTGRQHSLPQRKDGSFDLDKLAAVLLRNAVYWKTCREKDAIKAANESVVLAAYRATGLDEPSPFLSVGPLRASPSDVEGRPVRVRLELNADVDRFQFERLVLFLRSEGHLEGR